MKRKLNKKGEVCILICCVLAVAIVFYGFVLWGILSERTCDDLHWYFEQFEHNENVVFVDENNYYFGEEELYHGAAYRFEDKVIHIDETYIYGCDSSNEELYFYKVERHTGDYFELRIFEKSNVLYHNSGKVVYLNFANEKMLYDSIQNTDKPYNEDIPEYTPRYTTQTNEYAFLETKFYVTDNVTGEKKRINDFKNNLLKLEQAKFLDDAVDIDFYDCFIDGDVIYVKCVSSIYIVTVYSFDFETEEFAFVDWNYPTDVQLQAIYILN